VVPPRDVAHHAAGYGTMNLLWLFGHSQQTPARQGLQAIGATAYLHPYEAPETDVLANPEPASE